VHREPEQVHGRQRRRQILLAVAEVVFEIVTLGLERIEALVLDLPSRSSTGQFGYVGSANGQIGDEAVAVGGFACRLDDLDLEPVDSIASLPSRSGTPSSQR
jgi:hypothetical protein